MWRILVIRFLSHNELCWKFSNLSTINSLSSKKNKKLGNVSTFAQERALSALDLGLGIKQRGYNIFVVGVSGTGRISTVEKILKQRAPKEDTPSDLVLLYNFNDRDRPLAISLPASHGPKLKKNYDSLMERVLAHLEKAFETDHYLYSKQTIQETCRETTDNALKEIEREANLNSFVLSHSGGSITLTPANAHGESLTEKEFDILSDDEKLDLEEKAERLEALLEESMRKVRQAERESEDAFDKLEKETASIAIAGIFETARNTWKKFPQIVQHLNSIEEDISNRIRRFTQEDRSTTATDNANNDQSNKSNKAKFLEEEDDLDSDEALFVRYRVNVLVTRPRNAGAPVVFETHPTTSNLIGRIEQKIKGGETVTDFTRIRAGALYKANGGYLIIEPQELLRDPAAWDGLKRALKNRVIELDDPGEPGRMISIASLRPEPVELNLKVILIGTPEIYYMLTKNDPDFQSLFKVKADFDLEADLSNDNIDKYIDFLHSISIEEKLTKIDQTALARIIEHAVRLAGNNKKITCRLGEIADLLRESNYWANKNNAKFIDASHVKIALNARAQREGFIESQIIDDVISGKIILDIKGKIIGQTNALTVVDIGNYNFGIALRVTCQIGCGKGEIIDIERETEQAGPFHSKGRLIIRGLLSHLFGRLLPFSFHATLCMEQTYSEIDGDSASLAEACALLSALSQTGIDQRFAMTGAIDQTGNIQAVGGINEKIEGFYKICQVKSSKEVHCVIIPTQNVNDLMLKEEIVESCKKGLFQIISAENIEDAMELLTGLNWETGPEALKKRCLNTLEHFNMLKAHDKIKTDLNKAIKTNRLLEY
jgi:predicted ATP-dependent protease